MASLCCFLVEFPGLCPALAIPLHPIPLGKSSTRPAVCRCQILKSPILGGGLGRGSGLQPFPSSLHDLGKSPPLAPCMLCEGRHHATLLTPFYDSAWHTAMDLVKYITQTYCFLVFLTPINGPHLTTTQAKSLGGTSWLPTSNPSGGQLSLQRKSFCLAPLLPQPSSKPPI